MVEYHGACTVPGVVEGELLVSSEPISFLGDVDPETGVVTNPDNPIHGISVKGKILAFPCGKGSTVGSYVIFQLRKNGVAPLAIITRDADAIVAVGAIISDIPMVNGVPVENLETGAKARLDCTNGIVLVGE